MPSTMTNNGSVHAGSVSPSRTAGGRRTWPGTNRWNSRCGTGKYTERDMT